MVVPGVDFAFKGGFPLIPLVLLTVFVDVYLHLFSSLTVVINIVSGKGLHDYIHLHRTSYFYTILPSSLMPTLQEEHVRA